MVEDPASAHALGRRLKHARLDRGMTQADVARGICDVSSVSYWESGRSVPEGDIVQKLAERLGIDTSVLTGQGFEPLTVTSPENFGSLIAASMENSADELDCCGEMARWLFHARRLSKTVDPWRRSTVSAQSLEFLRTSQLSTLSPAGMATFSLLERLGEVAENPDNSAVSRLVEVLMWAKDAPTSLRDQASEIAASLYLFQGMPYAAQSVLTRAPLSRASVAFEELDRIAQSVGKHIDLESEFPVKRVVFEDTPEPRDARDAAVRLIRILHEDGERPARLFALAGSLVPGDLYISECLRLLDTDS